jgi:hypothetical protein
VKTQLTARGARNSGKQFERKTLGSGLNAGNIGAEIDVIKPTLPVQNSRREPQKLSSRYGAV